MKWPLIFLAILIFPIISGLCEDGQIDINSASIEELDLIKWVGVPTAEKIIAARPFISVEDLTKVSGIAEGKLSDIKNQSLACVKDEDKYIDVKKLPEEKEIILDTLYPKGHEKGTSEIIEEDEPEVLPEFEQVSLNPKVIKTDNSKESYNVYAIWGLVTFSILLVLLFMLSKLKEDKNEFD